MSVPTWKRTEASTQYLWEIYQLNLDIAEIVANKPKKYKSTHSDLLVKTALMALSNANIANDIYITNEEDFKLRREYLTKAKGYTYNVALLGDIFLELCKKSPECDKRKCTKQQERIGTRCAKIIKLVSGVMKSDKNRYKV